MLQGFPTRNGTGIAIWGDYGDLTSLYETVHEIANTLDDYSIHTKGQSQLLMNFAYEIRKAYSGQRLCDKFTFNGDNQHELRYYGFQIVWPDILIFLATLRHNAGYIKTNSLHQANLYMLEYVNEIGLKRYDLEGSLLIKEGVENRINIGNKYCFLLYQAVHIQFVKAKPGKKRFRHIPQLIETHFCESSPEYKELIRSIEVSANQTNSDITDFELEDDFEIKW